MICLRIYGVQGDIVKSEVEGPAHQNGNHLEPKFVSILLTRKYVKETRKHHRKHLATLLLRDLTLISRKVSAYRINRSALSQELPPFMANLISLMMMKNETTAITLSVVGTSAKDYHCVWSD